MAAPYRRQPSSPENKVMFQHTKGSDLTEAEAGSSQVGKSDIWKLEDALLLAMPLAYCSIFWVLSSSWKYTRSSHPQKVKDGIPLTQHSMGNWQAFPGLQDFSHDKSIAQVYKMIKYTTDTFNNIYVCMNLKEICVSTYMTHTLTFLISWIGSRFFLC